MTRLLLSILLFASFPLVQADENQAVVLMYHRFGESQHPSTNIKLAQFDAHLDFLSQAGYEVWPLKKVVRHLTEKRPFPTQVVAISIDDAYLSVYTEAYPRMKQRGWPFTVFVSSDAVDNRISAFMNWQQMREMQAHDVSFENHSDSHDYLVQRGQGETEDQWLHRVTADINRAQQRITEELGDAPTLFAYPYGEYSTTLANVVKDFGLVAFGQQSGPAGLDYDQRALPRFPMAEQFGGIDDFKQKARTLAFPLLAVQPWDPLLDKRAVKAPRMELRLVDSTAQLDQLACFASGEGKVEIEWLDRNARHFSVQASKALSQGRSRYNCTAPSLQPERYYWFSHLWVTPP
jgi:biofilm PGA synthesis lipoprotein PgaB